MMQYGLHGFPLLALLVVLSAFGPPTDATRANSCDECLPRVTSGTNGNTDDVPTVYWLSVGGTGHSDELFGGCFGVSEPIPSIESRLHAAVTNIQPHRVSTRSEGACSRTPPPSGKISNAGTCLSCVLEGNSWCNWGATKNSGFCGEGQTCDYMSRLGLHFGPAVTSREECCGFASDRSSCMEPERECSWCTVRTRVCDGLLSPDAVQDNRLSAIEAQNAEECNALKPRTGLDEDYNPATCDQCVEAGHTWCQISVDDRDDIHQGGICLEGRQPSGICKVNGQC